MYDHLSVNRNDALTRLDTPLIVPIGDVMEDPTSPLDGGSRIDAVKWYTHALPSEPHVLFGPRGSTDSATVLFPFALESTRGHVTMVRRHVHRSAEHKNGIPNV